MKKYIFWVFLCTSVLVMAQEEGFPYALAWGSYMQMKEDVNGNASEEGIYGNAAVLGLTIDELGNSYIVGQATCYEGALYYTTEGAFQEECQGDTEAYLAKFSPDGEMLWATFFGGEGDEHIESVRIDANQNIVVVGGTNSTQNISTSGAFQENISSNTQDGFIAKFSEDGVLLWSTYYGAIGGNTNTDIGDVVFDSQNNLYVYGSAGSSTNIATPGSFTDDYNGWGHAGFLAKFTPAGERLWATYYGYNPTIENVTNATSIAIDSNDNVYIAGDTNDTSGYFSTAGSYQEGFNGGRDVFLAKFSSEGERVWATYFGGENVELGCGVICDQDDNVYITGRTYSDNDIATANAYQALKNGDSDLFLTKFTPNGELVWSTYYGGSELDSLERQEGVTVDEHNNIIMAINTHNTGLATSNVYQEALGGDTDALLVSFNEDGGLLWATYYGGENNEGSIVVSSNATSFLIGGYTSSFNNIATSDGYFTEPYDDFGTGFFAKFDIKNLEAESFSTTKIKLWPNPNNGIFSIEGSAISNAQELTLEVYNVEGKMLENLKFQPSNASKNSFDFSNKLRAGIYFIKIKQNNKVLGALKIIKE